MLRSCSKCGRVHDTSFKCNCGRLPQTNEQALRNLNKWHRKSEEIRERSFHLCAICRENGDFTPKNVEVHHIRKLRDYPQGLTEDENLICLCVFHHKEADKNIYDEEYLKKLVDKRDGVGGAMMTGDPPEGYRAD